MITSVSGVRVATRVGVRVAAEFYYWEPDPAVSQCSPPNVTPAVDHDRFSGHEVGFQQINHRTHNIVHGTKPFERRGSPKALASSVVPTVRQQNDARRDGIYPN